MSKSLRTKSTIILSSILTQTLMLADKLFSALFQMTRHNAWLEIKITLTF